MLERVCPQNASLQKSSLLSKMPRHAFLCMERGICDRNIFDRSEQFMRNAHVNQVLAMLEDVRMVIFVRWERVCQTVNMKNEKLSTHSHRKRVQNDFS